MRLCTGCSLREGMRRADEDLGGGLATIDAGAPAKGVCERCGAEAGWER